MFNQVKNKIMNKRIIKILILIIISILTFCFIMKNFFPAEWSFITPHKQGDFVRVGNMNFPSGMHSGAPILLDDGRVLFIGQERGKEGVKKCEYFYPKTRKFHLFDVIDLKMPGSYKEVKLLDGRVLFVGAGRLGKANYSVFFNPENNNFTKGSGLITGRWRHAAILLKDGRVFVAGGELDDWEKQKIKKDKCFRLKTTEFYNPKTHSFEKGPDLPEELTDLKMFLDKNGNVIMLGGYNNKFEPNYNIYLFNPRTSNISKIGELKVKRHAQSIFMLSCGEILVMQGSYSEAEGIAKEIEIFKPETQTIEIVNTFNQKKRKSIHSLYLSIAKCPDDIVILYGGSYSDPFLTQTFIDIDMYDAKNNKFSKTRKKTNHSYNYLNSNIVLKDGNILLIGGGKTRLGAEIYKVNKKIKR